MIYWQLFLAFFIPGILGYGGGPASIPLVEYEVVENYNWMTSQEFSEMVAVGNALPGPIATKMAGFVGYEQGGILGIFVALFATVAPSLILMIFLMSILMKYKDSKYVKNLTNYIRPIIAVLLAAIFIKFTSDSLEVLGWGTSILLMGISFWLLEKRKWHPVVVILLSLSYGAISTFI